ncbi:Ubiquitin fusion degradation protein 4 [Puccinia graminis f. sp. tritici]|uniref:Ubiquitin fusion degradation protein 4 n=1 Tax=Puccinia graminis f. sp. tritici TaxID=56615 RepID=A0A5B0N1N6_PUCGR|nr:Ubiquitin fusion degradation protein 4 [Puccinia graminis f. sp. tritici]
MDPICPDPVDQVIQTNLHNIISRNPSDSSLNSPSSFPSTRSLTSPSPRSRQESGASARLSSTIGDHRQHQRLRSILADPVVCSTGTATGIAHQCGGFDSSLPSLPNPQSSSSASPSRSLSLNRSSQQLGYIYVQYLLLATAPETEIKQNSGFLLHCLDYVMVPLPISIVSSAAVANSTLTCVSFACLGLFNLICSIATTPLPTSSSLPKTDVELVGTRASGKRRARSASPSPAFPEPTPKPSNKRLRGAKPDTQSSSTTTTTPSSSSYNLRHRHPSQASRVVSSSTATASVDRSNKAESRLRPSSSPKSSTTMPRKHRSSKTVISAGNLKEKANSSSHTAPLASTSNPTSAPATAKSY